MPLQMIKALISENVMQYFDNIFDSYWKMIKNYYYCIDIRSTITLIRLVLF